MPDPPRGRWGNWIRRPARWLFTLAAFCSLVIFILAIPLWIRSFYVGDKFEWAESGTVRFPDDQAFGHTNVRSTQLFHGRGSIGFQFELKHEIGNLPFSRYGRQNRLPTPGFTYTPVRPAPIPLPTTPSFAGLILHGDLARSANTYRYPIPTHYLRSVDVVVLIPYWFLTAMSAILPPLWFWRFKRNRSRNLEGCCAFCGYDLRATPDRCPECGRVTKNTKIQEISIQK